MFMQHENNVATLNIKALVLLPENNDTIEITIVFTCCIYSVNKLISEAENALYCLLEKFNPTENRHNEMC